MTLCDDGCGALCDGDVCDCGPECEGRQRVEREARARHSGVATSAVTNGVCEGGPLCPHAGDPWPGRTLWETTIGWLCWGCCCREWPPPFIPYHAPGASAL